MKSGAGQGKRATSSVLIYSLDEEGKQRVGGHSSHLTSHFHPLTHSLLLLLTLHSLLSLCLPVLPLRSAPFLPELHTFPHAPFPLTLYLFLTSGMIVPPATRAGGRKSISSAPEDASQRDAKSKTPRNMAPGKLKESEPEGEEER